MLKDPYRPFNRGDYGLNLNRLLRYIPTTSSFDCTVAGVVVGNLGTIAGLSNKKLMKF